MVGRGWVLDFTKLMQISTQVEVGVEVGVELGNNYNYNFNHIKEEERFDVSIII